MIFSPKSNYMMLGSKDALRIVTCFALPQSCPIFGYRGIFIPLLSSYRGGSLSHKTTFMQAYRGLWLLTLASYKSLKECVEIPIDLDTYVNDYNIHVIEVAWLSEEQLKQFKTVICNDR